MMMAIDEGMFMPLEVLKAPVLENPADQVGYVGNSDKGFRESRGSIATTHHHKQDKERGSKKTRRSVRFTDAPPQVITLEERPEEAAYRKVDVDTMNAEYRKEKRLYELIVSWKKRNASRARKTWREDAPVHEFLGRENGVRAGKHGLTTVGKLKQVVSVYVADMWPLAEMKQRKEHDMSCIIVLALVGELLSQSFIYDLSAQPDQDRLYEQIFHISQTILRSYACVATAP